VLTVQSPASIAVVSNRTVSLLLCSTGSRLCSTNRYEAATLRNPAEIHFYSHNNSSATSYITEEMNRDSPRRDPSVSPRHETRTPISRLRSFSHNSRRPEDIRRNDPRIRQLSVKLPLLPLQIHS